MSNSTKNPIRLLFVVLLLLILLCKTFFIYSLVNLALAFLGTVCILFGVCALWVKYDRIESFVRGLINSICITKTTKLLAILFLANLFTKLAAICFLRIDSISSHPDIYCYAVTADELAKTGIVKTFANYCYKFSHMFWFAFFLIPAVRLLGFTPVGFSVYLSIIESISTVLLFDICAHIYRKEKAFFVFLLYTFLPSQILLSQYITHEQACLFFVSLVFWVSFRIPERKTSIRMFKVLLIALLFLFAIEVNTGGIVFLIAWILANAVLSFTKKNIKYLFQCVIILLVFLFGSTLMQNYQIQHSAISEEIDPREKIIWTLFVGSNAETEGAWSEADRQLFASAGNNVLDGKAKEELLQKRYRELFCDPQRIILLAAKKFSTIWSAFTYPIMYSSETIMSERIQQFYNSVLRNPAVLYEYVLSTTAVIWGIVARIKTRKKEIFVPIFTVIVELSLIGYSSMLLVTECSNKYTITVQPFFWIACLIIVGEVWNDPQYKVSDS